jgi:hypothetical protein
MTTKKQDEERRQQEEEERKQRQEAKQRQEQQRGAAGDELKPGQPTYPDPQLGSTTPSTTTMANPPPQNVPIAPQPPTDDPMATPLHGQLPNPPSRPGGDMTGEPNVSATGEKLSPDHPDYRRDAEGQHAPDHRSAEEKRADQKRR